MNIELVLLILTLVSEVSYPVLRLESRIYVNFLQMSMLTFYLHMYTETRLIFYYSARVPYAMPNF